MRHARWTLALLLSINVLTLAGCGRQVGEGSDANRELEMRYLEVSPDRTEALVDALNALLTPSAAGKASMAGPGQILVRADAGTLEQIASSLEQMREAKQQSQPQPDSGHRVRLQTWALKAGEGLDALPPAAPEIRQALTGLPYADWRQLEASVQTRTTDGRPSLSSGVHFGISATLLRLGEDYLAELSLTSSRTGSVTAAASLAQEGAEARLTMKPGEYMLLSFRDERGAGEALVVRIEPIDPAPAP
ncbi:MAG: hypothetical protein H4O13_17960 [Xanthomonadales bacterium]|nr:hypothetical protein [Xanthomonadales bacterium]